MRFDIAHYDAIGSQSSFRISFQDKFEGAAVNDYRLEF